MKAQVELGDSERERETDRTDREAKRLKNNAERQIK